MIINQNKHIFTNKGFSLMELLVVIAIIGLLSSVTVVSLNTARMKARDGRRVMDIQQIQLALEMYHDVNNEYPTDIYAETGSLKPDFLGMIPTDPKDSSNYFYTYSGATDPDYYHLGVTLEDSNNSALGSDQDCSSLTTSCPAGVIYSGSNFNGIAGTCSQTSGVDTCYDVTE